MEKEYVKELDHTYLVIGDGQIDDDEYSFQMIIRGRLPGVLPLSVAMKDGKKSLRADVTACTSIASRYKSVELTGHDLREILSAIRDASLKMPRLLISARDLCLEPDCIFLGPGADKVLLCYVPHLSDSEPDTIRSLAEFFLKRIDHSDQAAAAIAYELFDRVASESYLLGDVLQQLLKDQNLFNSSGPANENTGRHSPDQSVSGGMGHRSAGHSHMQNAPSNGSESFSPHISKDAPAQSASMGASFAEPGSDRSGSSRSGFAPGGFEGADSSKYASSGYRSAEADSAGAGSSMFASSGYRSSASAKPAASKVRPGRAAASKVSPGRAAASKVSPGQSAASKVSPGRAASSKVSSRKQSSGPKQTCRQRTRRKRKKSLMKKLLPAIVILLIAGAAALYFRMDLTQIAGLGFLCAALIWLILNSLEKHENERRNIWFDEDEDSESDDRFYQSLRQELYAQDSCGHDSYERDSYRQDSYGRDSYGQDSYKQDSYGQNLYGQGSGTVEAGSASAGSQQAPGFYADSHQTSGAYSGAQHASEIFSGSRRASEIFSGSQQASGSDTGKPQEDADGRTRMLRREYPVLVSLQKDRCPDITLNRDYMIIGKSKAQSDIILSDSTVSRKHARIERRTDGYYVTDLFSTNGTFLDGHRLESGQAVILNEGAQLTIASLHYHITFPQTHPDKQLY